MTTTRFWTNRLTFANRSKRKAQRPWKNPAVSAWLRVEALEKREVPSATVVTDQPNYGPGDTAYITGSGYGANETVNLTVVLANGTQGAAWSVTDDANGNFSTSVGVPSDGSWATIQANPLTLTATGQPSGLTAHTTFTDDPEISSLSPNSATEGGAAFTLTVNGSGFGNSPGAVVQWNGTALTTTWVSHSRLTASVPAADIADEGSNSVTVKLGGETSDPATFTVNDAPLTGSSAATAGGTEGATNSSVLSGATFTDAKPGDNHAEMTATITWGDGGPTSSGVVSYSGGTSYTVAGSHTYAEEGTKTISIAVRDAGGSTTTITGTATVADAALTGSSAATAGGTEGATNSSVLSGATFTDANPGDNHAEMTATITWGDGGPTSTGTVSFSGGVYTVAGSHTYAEEGTKTISIAVVDAGGSTTTITGTATVADAALTSVGSSPIVFVGPRGTGSETSNVSSFTFNPSASITAGDAIIGELVMQDPSISMQMLDVSSITDNASGGSNTYTKDIDVLNSNSSNHQVRTIIFSAINVRALTASSTITITFSGGNVQFAAVSIAEFSGLATAPLDKTASNTDGSTTSPSSGTTATTTQANELLIGAIGYTNNSSFTAESSPISFNALTTASASTAATIGPEYALVSATGAYAATGTLGSAAYWAGAIATYKAQLPSLTPPTATEGVAFSNVTVFHFTDADPAALVTDYTAVVTLGDSNTVTLTSTPSANGQIVAHSGGGFDVQLSYTYADELSNATFGVTVTDHNAMTSQSTNTFSVADHDTLTGTGTSISATEGAALASTTTVATFTDTTYDNAAADFNATINWGDSTTSTGTVTRTSAGHYSVSGGHTYVEEGTYSVQVTLSDNSPGTASAMATSTATVADPAVVPTGKAVSATEGAAFTAAVATFTDPGGAEAVGNYSATINWGDSTTSAGTISVSGGTFTVTGSHTYAEEGSYTITTTISHDVAPNASTTSTATVADPAVVPTGKAVSATEGAAFTAAVATFTDPGGAEVVGDYTATINWGDSTSSAGTITLSGGVFTVTGSHTYAEEGSYTITTTISHDVAPNATTTSTATVADPAVVPTGGFTVTAVEGNNSGSQTVATFTDPGGAEALTDYAASIAWGDSTNSAGTITVSGGVFTVKGSHTYAEEGSYTITVTLSHDVAPNASTTSSATVSDPAVVPTGVAVSATEGAAFTAAVATFTDPGGPEVVGDYSATINWGDSTTSAGTISVSGGVFTVTGSHTYVEEGSYTITTTISHDVAPTATTTSTATVADQQLTNLASANLPASTTEGATVPAITGIATFTDPAGVGVEPITDFTATVNWGDSTTSTGTIVSLGGGNYRVDAPAHKYIEEGTYTVNVTLKHDALAAVTTPNQTIVVNDVTPTITSITGPTAPIALAGNNPSVTANFTDPGILDTHTCTFNWDDNSSTSVAAPGMGSGSCTASHTYAAAGVYSITVTVKDDDGPSATGTFQFIVIFNPDGAFITGGGTINSPVGALVGSTATGQANFGFNAKYLASGALQGQDEFNFPTGNFKFHGTVNNFLAITPLAHAEYQASGRVNGVDGYTATVLAWDDSTTPGCTGDRYRINITNSANVVVYDNGSGPLDTDTCPPPTTSGDIVVHPANQTAAGGAGHNLEIAPLTATQLQPIWTAALARWEQAGATPAQVSPLAQVTVQIVSLPPGILARTGPGHIWISPDAAGYGWFVDPTPADDVAFNGQPGSPAQNRMDLLSVVAHEMGHIILWMDESDQPNDVMTEALPAGVRRMPTPADLGKVEVVAAQPLDHSLAVVPATVTTGSPADTVPNPGNAVNVDSSLDGTLLSLALSPPVDAGARPVPAVLPSAALLDDVLSRFQRTSLDDGLVDDLVRDLVR